MKIYVLLIFSLLSFMGFGQDSEKLNIFLDENLKPINQLDFIHKSNSALYRKSIFETDSVIINKLITQYITVTFEIVMSMFKIKNTFSYIRNKYTYICIIDLSFINIQIVFLMLKRKIKKRKNWKMV